MREKGQWAVRVITFWAGLSDRDALKYNADGSPDLFIQNENPGPDGRWNPPAIKRSTSIGRALQ